MHVAQKNLLTVFKKWNFEVILNLHPNYIVQLIYNCLIKLNEVKL